VTYDDSLDVFGVHGVGGILGTLATGLLANAAINDKAGLFYGNAGQFVSQVVAVGVTIIYSFGATYVLLLAVNAFSKLRASEHEEAVGLDLTQHRESAYTVLE